MGSFVQKAAPAAGAWATIAAIPADGSIGVINVRVINRDQINQVVLSLAITSAAGDPTVVDHIVPPNLVLNAGEIMEETALAVAPGELVQIYTSAASLTTRTNGR